MSHTRRLMVYNQPETEQKPSPYDCDWCQDRGWFDFYDAEGVGRYDSCFVCGRSANRECLEKQAKICGPDEINEIISSTENPNDFQREYERFWEESNNDRS